MNDCLKAMDAANNGRLSDDEMEAIAEEIQRAQKARADLDGLERDLFDAAEQVAADAELAARVEKRNRLIGIVKEAELLALSRRGYEATGDAAAGLRAAMVGLNAPFDGARASVDAKANGIVRMHMGGMIADLQKAGLLAKFNSGEMSGDIARELWDLSLPAPTGKASKSGDAKAIAAVVHKYRRALIERENRAGAVIRYRSGYVTRQTHDSVRMRRAGFDAWRDAVATRLDWDEMRVPPERRAEFLRKVYNNLASRNWLDIAQTDESGIAFAFKGPGNLAKKESASRVLLFKSADDWMAYNEAFGRSSLNEAILADFQRSARSTALMDTFGTNPRAMFDRVRDKIAVEFRDKGMPEQVDAVRRRTLDNEFAEIDGTVNMEGNHAAALVGRSLRAIQTMAKLGGAVISSVTDLATLAAERRFQGRSIADSWMDAFNGAFEGVTAGAEKRRMAELIGVGIDGALGDFVSRFAAQDDAPGRMSKLMGVFFKFNLLGPWTDSVKRGVGLMMARDLAMAAAGDWATVPADMQRLLRVYGIGEADWPRVQTGIIEGPDGKSYLAPESVQASDETRAAIRERDRIREALASYIADRGDFASPTPGARERAMLRQGLQPGTGAGEAIRFLTQFKAFPITVITKTLGAATYGRGARTMRDAFVKGQGDRLGLVSFIAGSTVLGLFALQAKELAKGREPRELSAETLTAAFLQGGGAGIYGDFIFGEANRFGGGVLDTVAGPAIGEAAKAIEILQRLRATTFDGEAPDVAAETLRFVRGNTPFINLFYTKIALDYLVFYQLQEMANPGYLRRLERRMKRENNQEFFAPPSEAIPRGGGNRILEGVR